MNIIRPALHHVALKTTRLREMIDWYSVVLGTDIVHNGPVNAWITNDAANHRIALFALPGQSDDPQKSTHNGIHHTAFEYENFADLMSSFKRMSDESLVPAFCLDHGMTTSLYYRDPTVISSNCRAIILVIGSCRPSTCVARRASLKIRSVTFSTQRNCTKPTRWAPI